MANSMINTRTYAIITGVAQGLGKFLAESLATNNIKIIGIDKVSYSDIKNKMKLEDYYCFDLRDIDKIPNLIKNILKKFPQIDILINNAGIKYFSLFEDINNDNTISDVITVNYVAPILLIKHILPVMKKNKFGRIINIASNAAFTGYIKGTIYNSSKSGLKVFGEALAKELSTDITINTICPATIATEEYKKKYPKFNFKKLIQPEEVVQVIENLIQSNINDKVIPLISIKSEVRYLLEDIKKHIKWLIKSLLKKR